MGVASTFVNSGSGSGSSSRSTAVLSSRSTNGLASGNWSLRRQASEIGASPGRKNAAISGEESSAPAAARCESAAPATTSEQPCTNRRRLRGLSFIGFNANVRPDGLRIKQNDRPGGTYDQGAIGYRDAAPGSSTLRW